MANLFDQFDAPAQGGNVFDQFDPPKRQVGVGEIARRTGSSIGNAAIAYGQMLPVGALAVADMVGKLFGGKGDLTTQYGDRFVQPNMNAIEANALKPDENAGAVGSALINMAPGLGKMVGDLALGGPLAKAAPALGPAVTAATNAIPATISALRQGAVVGLPAGFRSASERFGDLQAAGASPLESVLPAAVTGLSTVGQFALPASAGSAAPTLAGRVASRGAQGAAINSSAGIVQRQLENSVLPDSAARARVDPTDPAAVIADALGGALFGQMGGRPEAFNAPNRLDYGYRPDPTVAPGATDFAPPTREPLPLDLAAATKAVNEALFSAEGGPTPPDLTLVPRGAPTPVVVPDATKAPIAPDWKLEGEPEPAPPKRMTVADQVKADPDLTGKVRQRIEADQAFRMARGAPVNEPGIVPDTQAVPETKGGMVNRKQGAQDEGAMSGQPRNLSDASASGSTSPEGTAALAPEEFTFLGVQRDRNGKVTSTGPQVEVVERFTAQDANGKPVEAARVRMPDGSEQVVRASDVQSLSRPANPRFAQDNAAGTYAPKRGVGTGPDQPAPRRAAQRITTTESPEYLPAAKGDNGPEPANPAGRPGETFDNRGPDGGGNRQLGPPPRDAATTGAEGRDPNAGRAPDAGRTVEETNGRSARVADPRDVPRLQVDYEKVTTQAKRVRTRINNLEAETPSAARNDKLAAAKEQLKRLEAKRADIAEQLTPERIPRAESSPESLLSDLRREGGVTPKMASDMGIDKKDPKLVRKGGAASEDQVVAAAVKRGWLTYEEGEAPGAYQRVVEMVREELGGRDAAPADPEAQARAREQADIEREAQELGVNTRDMTRQQAAEAVAEARAKKMEAQDIAEANAAAEDVRMSDMDGRTIDELLDEVGVTDKDIEDAKWRRESEAESKAAADEAQRARPGGGEDQGLPDEPRPRKQANPDEVRVEPEPRNEADRARPGEGDRGAGEERPAGGEAGGKSAPDDPRYRLNALPLDAAWSGLKQSLRHLVSDDSASAPLRKAIGDALSEAKAGNWREAVAKTLGALVWSDASVVRSVADARNSPTLHKIWRMFSDMGGTEKIHGETFEQEVHARYNRNINTVAELLEPLTPDQAKQVKALIENRQAIRPNADGAHKAAKQIADLLDAERKWLKDSGVEIGTTKNYVPRVYLVREIVAKAAEFKAAATRAYRLMGLDAKEAAQAAEDWYTATRLKGDGVPEVPFLDLSGGAPQKNFAKTREIPLDVLRKSGLDKFTDQDLFGVLDGYFRRTAKRGAFESRFGGTDEGGANVRWKEMRKALDAEGNGDLIAWAENRILSMSGQMKADVSDGIRATMSLARAVTVATFLRRAVISSLTEPLQIANRTAAQGTGKAIKNALVMYARGADRLVRMLSGVGQSASAEDRLRMARMLGTVLHERVDSGVAALRFDGDTLPNEKGNAVSRAADRLSFAAMKASGLHDWTTANMVDSTIMGMDFIKAMAEDAAGGRKLANYELDRLGIAEADHAAFAKYAAKVGSADQLIADMRAGNKQAAQYVAAIDKFSRQVIMKPTAADKPVLAKHPVAQMAYGLQSWMYSYWYNVQRANLAQVKEAVTGKGYSGGDRVTMAAAPVLYTAAMLSMTGAMLTTLRDLYAGRDKDKEREEKRKKASIMGMPVETIRTLSQAQMFGLADPFINSMTSARYNKLPGSELGGPLVGRVQRAALDRGALVTDKNSPNTNTAERKAAESAFNLTVDPALAVASASLPMPLAAAATFASQRDELRQAYIDWSAGKHKK